MILDLTPMAINRTAVYKIGKSLVKNLELNQKIQIGLDRFNLSELQDYLVQPNLQKKVLTNLDKKNSPSSFLKNRGATLYLDALWASYHKTSSEDYFMIYDITPHTNPDWHGFKIAQKYTEIFTRIYQSKSNVLASSSATKLDLVLQLGIHGSRIQTFPLFPMLKCDKSKNNKVTSPGRFILFIGNLEPRKNLRGLLHAYFDSKLLKSGIELHIVGAGGHGSSEIIEFAKLIPGVILHGYLADSEVIYLLQKCEAFVYPSLLEGFGVPVLEAIENNCHLLLTNRGATPELAPQDAVMVDPQNHAELTRCLKQVVEEAPEMDIYSRKRIMEKNSEANFINVIRENCPNLNWR